MANNWEASLPSVSMQRYHQREMSMYKEKKLHECKSAHYGFHHSSVDQVTNQLNTGKNN